MPAVPAAAGPDTVTAPVETGEEVTTGEREHDAPHAPLPARMTTAGNPPASPASPASPLTILRPVATPKELIEAQGEMRAYIKAALVKGRDFGTIPGVNKPTLFKPGAERINSGFGVVASFAIIEREVDHDRPVKWRKTKAVWEGPKGRRRKVRDEVIDGESLGLYRYVIECTLTHRETGRVVGSCMGSCSTMESKYIDRPRDCENTAIKMAEKRAYVGATLLTYGLSDEFTQDVEDMPGEVFSDDDEGRSQSSEPGAQQQDDDIPEPSCPVCGGRMWDNRTRKTNPKAPDYKCRNRDCEGKYWPNEWQSKVKKEREAEREAERETNAVKGPVLPIPDREHTGMLLSEIPVAALSRYARECLAVIDSRLASGKDTSSIDTLLDDINEELTRRGVLDADGAREAADAGDDSETDGQQQQQQQQEVKNNDSKNER